MNTNELLKYILFLVLLIGIAYIAIYTFDHIAFGQTVAPPKTGTPPAVTVTPPTVTPPTVTNVPTPTSPTPNLQYLPQKAFVQSYAPEIGIPSSTVPLQALPPVIAPPAQQQNSTGFPTDIMGMLAAIAAGGAYLKGHFAHKTANNATDLSKEALAAEVRTKEQLADNTKYTFSLDPAKANAINDLPSIKLETLEKEKAELAEKAAKA